MKKLITALLVLFVLGCNNPNKEVNGLLKEGGNLFQQGNYEAAITQYNAALEIQPDNPIAYNLLGMAYRFRYNQTGAQQYKDKEIESFQKAISLDPNYWVAYKNLAASLYYQNRKKEAVPYLEKALELQPNDPEKTLLLQWIEEGKNIE